MKWLLSALVLSALVGAVDAVAFFTGMDVIRASPVSVGPAVFCLLAVYLAVGLAATGALWWRGQHVDAGPRTAGTIAFLLFQGLVVALMSLMTLLGNRY